MSVIKALQNIQDPQSMSNVTLTAVTTKRALDVAIVSGGGGGPDPVGLKNTSATPINPATEDTLSTLLTESAFEARVNTLGQKTMAASMPMVLASDQSTLPIEGEVSVGSSISGNPVPIGLRDLTGQVEYMAGNDLGGSISLGLVQMFDAGLVPINFASDGSVVCVGNTPAGSTDSDAGEGPVKIGYFAQDYQPDTEDPQGIAVTAGQRANAAANLRGELIEGVNQAYHLFDGTFPDTGLDGEYTSTNASSTSESVEWWNYRVGAFAFALSKTGTPTDFTIEIYWSVDGTNFEKASAGPLGLWIYDDVTVGSGITRVLPFPILGRFGRVVCTGTGLGSAGVTSFTMDDSKILLRN